MHDVSGRDREVLPDLERPRVDLRRHAAVVTHVVRKVAGTGDEALTAGLHRLGDRVRVRQEVVGRRHGLGEERHGEVRPDAALGVELDLVDEAVGGVSVDEVRLHEAVQERVVVPGRVGEAAVAPLGGHVAPADGDAEELAAGVERRRDRSTRLHGHTLAEPAEGGDELAAGEADEGVGAEDGRVVALESRGGHRSVTPPSTTSTCPVA